MNHALMYNEMKCSAGLAVCLTAENFLLSPESLPSQKLSFLLDRLSLNKRASVNTLHISLNFSAEDIITQERLVAIASEFMERIGYTAQPYLVYQHYDAGHPHLHVVTTNIREDGSRIPTHNMGRNEVNTARQAIEKEYQLTVAKGRSVKMQLIPVEGQKIKYGKQETLRSITTVLQNVLNDYKYESLNELNAILRLYNVEADRGDEQGRIYKTGGLTYHILDPNGKPVGVPIKASAIIGKPTLQYLEQKFAENKVRKTTLRHTMKTTIDWTLKKNMHSLSQLASALKEQNISLVIRRSADGAVYGITYVDHKHKAVHNGADLGKQYAAKGLLLRLGLSYTHKQMIEPERHLLPKNNLLQLLVNTEQKVSDFPYESIREKKKRRRKKL
jgi:hypothetical protein